MKRPCSITPGTSRDRASPRAARSAAFRRDRAVEDVVALVGAVGLAVALRAQAPRRRWCRPRGSRRARVAPGEGGHLHGQAGRVCPSRAIALARLGNADEPVARPRSRASRAAAHRRRPSAARAAGSTSSAPSIASGEARASRSSGTSSDAGRRAPLVGWRWDAQHRAQRRPRGPERSCRASRSPPTRRGPSPGPASCPSSTSSTAAAEAASRAGEGSAVTAPSLPRIPAGCGRRSLGSESQPHQVCSYGR